MRLRPLLLLLVVAALPALPTQAFAQKIRLLGVLLDSFGHPAANHIIGLVTLSGVSVARARTDGEGHFALTVPFPGRFRVAVMLPGGQSAPCIS
jgi:hypothetical protein